MAVNYVALAGALLGGLGLFLLAVGMMTDGLKQAAGKSLRDVLANWTRTPLRGVFSGFLMTAIVQSSSAVTVASIGFVNAGLLSMHRALGVIYGANVGTTITGWLVVLIGFKLNIEAFALPMIGIGMIARIVQREGRMAALGMALVGFGLFFVGIDILKNAFEGLVAAFDLTRITLQGPGQIALFLVIGFVMTILTQSSSASIALTITAAATGVVGIYAAAAMVIGANVGTTTTALLASIGATANAKRVALAQVLFNVGTAVVALLILPLLFLVVHALSRFLELEADPTVTLAMFHTVFNVLGVLLALPLTNILARYLEGRFIEREERTLQPQFLDKAIATTPVLAVNALVLELEALAERVRNLSHLCLYYGRAQPSEIAYELKHVLSLSAGISKFIVGLQKNALTEETSHQLDSLLRIDQYLLSTAHDADGIYHKLEQIAAQDLAYLQASLESYQAGVLAMLTMSPETDYEQSLVEIQALHDQVKASLVSAGALGRVEFDTMMTIIDMMAVALHVAQQWLKAMRNLRALSLATGTQTRLIPPLQAMAAEPEAEPAVASEAPLDAGQAPGAEVTTEAPPTPEAPRK
ncbi:Na/Pi symporter [Halioxenophilus sp. WMMB6]|uniref:Na/Pi cotransporter family protein n=1 Tax=Halioxenophilus sp. WMMB6 TaxID=3073815 RepID=UPI00295F066C|nr:Na/Pi symporter [Halioxenophilus sp. WMMB6]